MESSPVRQKSNQLNALKSTGPRTLEGKQKTRLNALKHGFFAQSIRFKDQAEETAFRTLMEGLVAS